MRFNLTLINPAGYKYAYLLTDTCRAIAYGLRSLGRRCDLTLNQIDRDATNIVVGTHLLSEQDAKGIAESGARYIAHQSEWLMPGTGKNLVDSSFHKDAFERVCRRFFERAEAVWDPYVENQRLLAKFNIPPERIRTLHMQGYHPGLEDVRHRDWAEKDIDVLFFGSVTPRRGKVLGQLAARVRVVAILDAPSEFRNDLIARAKINLNLHAGDEFTHLSLSRIGYLLNNRCAVVSENASTHPELQALTIHDSYDRLVPLCLDALAAGKLEETAAASYEKFKAMPMTEVLRPLV
ncbi:MAG: hypothetical protein HYY17_16080 [Planctomycetes bacterium]|nr:hypothetical protein [Planctomycetota bacterium]